MAGTNERTGRRINERYEAFDELGRGGQGVVYRATDRWMQREVAIKVLASKAVREPQMAERMIREQQALSSLKGTAAVEVLDICRGDGGELCLVMELLTGTDLENHLYSIEDRKERMPLPRVAEIFDPIVDTLEVAHNAGILHRDLKPANVFLLDGGGVRLLDFGMARLRKAAPLTAAGTVMGSPSFMAPEAWKGQSALVDKRADVYSLGVILFRVLAGDLPFSGTSLQHKFLGTTQSERPSLIARRPDLPRGADDWVAVALAIDREERFSNVRALWSSFLTALKLQSPKRQNRAASFWASAKQVMKRVAGSEAGSSKALPNAEDSTERTGEPSFGTEALARSVMHLQPLAPDALHPAVEKTVELTGSDLHPAGPPSQVTGGVEKTLELEAADLVDNETLPIGAQAPPTATPAVDKPVASTGSPPPPRRPRGDK